MRRFGPWISTALPLTARLAMRAFSLLFALNTNLTTLGWQLVAVAVEPTR